MYDFEFWQELAWLILVTAVIQVATVMVGFSPEAITDWRAWGVALAGGLVRAIAGVVLAKFTDPSRQGPPPSHG